MENQKSQLGSLLLGQSERRGCGGSAGVARIFQSTPSDFFRAHVKTERQFVLFEGFEKKDRIIFIPRRGRKNHARRFLVREMKIRETFGARSCLPSRPFLARNSGIPA